MLSCADYSIDMPNSFRDQEIGQWNVVRIIPTPRRNLAYGCELRRRDPPRLVGEMRPNGVLFAARWLCAVRARFEMIHRHIRPQSERGPRVFINNT